MDIMIMISSPISLLKFQARSMSEIIVFNKRTRNISAKIHDTHENGAKVKVSAVDWERPKTKNPNQWNIPIA